MQYTTIDKTFPNSTQYTHTLMKLNPAFYKVQELLFLKGTTKVKIIHVEINQNSDLAKNFIFV